MGKMPENLDRFIQLANFEVDHAARIRGCPILEEVRPKTFEEILVFHEKSGSKTAEQLLSENEDAAERLKDTGLYVEDSPSVTLFSYNFARKIRETLVLIARAVRSGSVERPIELPHLSSSVARVGRDRRISIGVSDSWESRQYALFQKAIDGVDAARIRECPRCTRIYWAQRSDKSYCSPGCRSREWVEGHPVEWAKIQDRNEERRRKARLRSASGAKGDRPIKAGVPGKGHGGSRRKPRMAGSTRRRRLRE